MEKTCRQCSEVFEVTSEDLTFYENVSPVFQGKKYPIPPPTLCPDCRRMEHLTFRNERMFYRRKCSLCRREMISVYSDDKPFPVYCPECFFNDQWDPLSFGKEFQKERGFFEQIGVLLHSAPRLAIHNTKSENAEYTNYSSENKNCYCMVSTLGSEDCYYGYRIFYCQNVIDCFDLQHCELCYECLESQHLYHCLFCRRCQNSSDLLLCEDCIGCHYCFGCFHLQNKQYYFFNERLPKEEYVKRVERNVQNLAGAREECKNFMNELPHRSATLLHCEECTGDTLFSCKRCRECFNISNSEDCIRIWNGDRGIFSYDVEFLDNSELIRNTMGTERSYNLLGCCVVWYAHDVFYSNTCFFCDNLFGCVGLHHKKYCILNKQYTKEEYEEMVPKILEKMRADGECGEFFPVTLSPFAYNETVAQEYFPLSREEVVKRGWRWRDDTDALPNVEKIIPAQELPDSIADVSDEILNSAVQCEATGRPFKIIKQELEFYRTMHLPLPHFHPDERHRRRMALRNPRKLWDRKCAKCQKEVTTSYSPDRPEIVVCEECYLKEVY